MPKKNQPPETINGPYVAAALLCENALLDSDGTLSAIRIVDRFKFVLPPDAPDDVPSEKNRLGVETNIIVGFKTGDASGDHALRLELENPSKEIQVILEKPITLGPHSYGGANLKMPTKMALKQAGVHWVNVLLNKKQVTRIPFEVVIERAEAPTAAPPRHRATSGQESRSRKRK